MNSNDAENDFVSVTQRKHAFCFGPSGGTERLGCETREMETWIVDSAATRHMDPESSLNDQLPRVWWRCSRCQGCCFSD